MIKTKLAPLACLAAAAAFVPSFASAAFAPNKIRIVNVEIGPTSGLTGTSTYIGISTSAGSVPSCHNSSFTQYVLVGDVDNVRALTALATTAYLAGRSVRVEFTGSCTGSYAQVKRILSE